MFINRNILFYFFLGFVLVQGQGKKYNGDDYFFAYAYQDAIKAYEAVLEKGNVLTPLQRLNLADSYFRIENFEKATDIYLELHAQDSVLGGYHLNKMLQGLGRVHGQQEVVRFLANKKIRFSKEMQENIAFNAKLFADTTPTYGLDFKVFNLEANSPQSDFSPTFYGTDLLFTSDRPLGDGVDHATKGEAYLTIFNGAMDPGGQVNATSEFSSIQSSDYHKATPYFSEELNSVFYVLSNTFEGDLEFDANGKNALGVGMQQIEGDFKFLWRDLSTSFYYPFYDYRTSRLYFAANLDDSYGGTDIYYVNTGRGQIMSAPINLGPVINTPGNEIAPYLFEGTLYFSSDVFYGMGGMDIYKSNLDIDQEFSVPVNLGDRINSSKDDFGFIIRNEGTGLLGYFSSNREGGKGKDDIYGFMVDEKPGIKTLALNGKIQKKYSGDPIKGASIVLETPYGERLMEVFSDGEGKYRIEAPWQDQVVLHISKDRFSKFKQEYGTEALEQLQKNPMKIALTAYDDVVEAREGQKVIKLKKFFFDRGSSNITAEIAAELDKLVEVVKAFPAMELRIENHTDSRGSSTTNFRLSQARSNAIREYIMQKGVPASNMLYTIGYGEDKLLNHCKNGVFCLEIQHRKNQRTLIVVLNDNILFN